MASLAQTVQTYLWFSRLSVMKKIFVLFGIVFLLGCGVFPVSAASPEGLQAAMSEYLSCLPMQAVTLDEQEISVSNEELCLAAVYAANGMKPLWVSEKGPGDNAEVIRRFLQNADTEGLQPGDYGLNELNSLWQSRQPEKLAELDTLLTRNLIKYAHDVNQGRLAPFISKPELFAEAGDRHFKPALIIKRALAAENLAAHLASLPPAHEYYRGLRDALRLYRNIAAAGGWEKVADGGTLRPGDSDARLGQVRKRLAATGETVDAVQDETLYDEPLVASIKRFQKSFGLKADGIIGPQTLAALNKSPEEIIRAIILNMTRWRWQKLAFGRRYVLVNIANYDLIAVEDGRNVLEMAVIVGKLQHQTPVFSRRVQYVDINPYWNIPPSIAANEELPELRKDPLYLVNRKVRLFSDWQENGVELDSTAIDWQATTGREMRRFKLRQDPGPWNALGRIKIVFPNEYNVYIHGTPAQELFERDRRSFSHGCIRASRPLELAEFLLAGEKQTWSTAKIQEIIDQDKRMVVSLNEPVTVHITYQTVWIDNSGSIRFNNDIYGRDGRLAEILFALSKDREENKQENGGQ